MTRITLDAELRSKLGDLSQPLELCDEGGTVIAEVYPVDDLCPSGFLEPPIDEAEMERRRRSDKWYTTEEVRRYLESL